MNKKEMNYIAARCSNCGMINEIENMTEKIRIMETKLVDIPPLEKNAD